MAVAIVHPPDCERFFIMAIAVPSPHSLITPNIEIEYKAIYALRCVIMGNCNI